MTALSAPTFNTLNLEVEALTTQVSELRENQQVLNEMKEFVDSL